MADYDGYYHYLPVNDDVMRWGLYVTGAGRGVIPAGQDYPCEGHPGLYDFQWSRGRVLPEFQIILISEGQGIFESEPTGEVAVTSDSLLFLFPGVWHRYRPDRSTGWTERWISFHGELTHRLLELHVLRPEAAVRRARTPKMLSKAFDRLLQRIHRDANQNSILLSMQTLSLIGTVVENAAARDELPGGHRTVRSKDVRDPLVRDALDLIWTHSHRSLSVQKIADRLASSRRALERHFRQELGHTVLDEIGACRISRAKRLLRETELGVKTVALLAGFPSEERMRVSFIQVEKTSPTEYRRNSLQSRKPRPGRPASAEI
ncbi:AraC family transcriptional regulator [Novipirellula artificiosorum]|uniref:Xylose operon regulatory protein n=1 Tax=Novipirellula artificiosorum TaxID=2528016 RepID=A0A5C6DLY1_9BACT|nr:helix-turn-helix domain-containing protein [Novipirellula artificiosorum]TWU38363.1 Xylose operon regulatory protein [Novipirellula artificiosorum]